MRSDYAGSPLVDCTLESSETAKLRASLDKIESAEILLDSLQSCAALAEQSEQLEDIRAQVQSISSLIKMRLHLCAYESRIDDYDSEAILADTEREDVVSVVKRAQAALLRLLGDPHGRRALN